MFLKVLLVSLMSMTGVLLWDRYLATREPPLPYPCDAGGDPPAPPVRDVKRLTLEEYPLPDVFQRWIDARK